MVKTTIAQSIALKAKASILKGLAARNPWSKYSVLYRNSFVQLVNLVFRGYRGIAARRGSDDTWGRSQATMAASASLENQFDFGDATKLARHSWVAFLTSARSTDLGELYRSLSKGHVRSRTPVITGKSLNVLMFFPSGVFFAISSRRSGSLLIASVGPLEVSPPRLPKLHSAGQAPAGVRIVDHRTHRCDGDLLRLRDPGRTLSDGFLKFISSYYMLRKSLGHTRYGVTG